MERLTQKVRKHWRMGSGPFENLQHYLESNGIIVAGALDSSSDIDSFCQLVEVNGKKVCIIALAIGSKLMEQLHLDMAHELGHILMHNRGEDNEGISREEFNAREWQANYFAGALLLPKESFTRSLLTIPTKVDCYKSLKGKWKVSMKTMMYRAHSLKSSMITGIGT